MDKRIEEAFDIWCEVRCEEHPYKDKIDTLMVKSLAFTAFMAAYEITIDLMIDELEE